MKQKLEKKQRSFRVPDRIIRESFAKAKSIKISARNVDHLWHQSASLGDLNSWLPLERMFKVVGVKPQMLRPIFGSGLRRVRTYGQLGNFHLSPEAFLGMARLFRKPVEAWKENEKTGNLNHIFTAHPNGSIERTD